MIVFLFIVFTVFYALVGWKVFEKAGQPGWAILVPIYSYVIMCRIAKKPDWCCLLMMIPYVNIIFSVWIINRTAKAFGKNEGFTIGLVLLSLIFWPILAWNEAEYDASLLD